MVVKATLGKTFMAMALVGGWDKAVHSGSREAKGAKVMLGRTAWPRLWQVGQAGW